MSSSSSSVKCLLYRKLLLKAKHFDKYPALKGVIPPAFSAEPDFPWLPKAFYSPCTPFSFVDLVRNSFRNRNTTTDLDQAFAVLKLLNAVNDKHFEQLYAQKTLMPVDPMALSAPRLPTLHAVRGPARLPKLFPPLLPSVKELARPLRRDLFSVSPLLVGAESGQLRRSDGSSNATTPQEDVSLAPGMLLVAHPQIGPVYTKAVMLVLSCTAVHVDMLMLNFPYILSRGFGPNNYVMPQIFRRHVCYIGGSDRGLNGFPPVPKYLILHAHPTIPSSRELVKDSQHPVCVSTGEAFPYIDDMIKRGEASESDFTIYCGSVTQSRRETEKQIRKGVWMPMEASSPFIHEVQNLGPHLWDGLLSLCGGEFDEMRRVEPVIQSQPQHQPPTETDMPGMAE
eukprot:NODE_396_length_1703_cov_453.199516_g315_i0.p1 GENE.NODE_396_length_1703_cov_453.199516_g315_i0~~NODE_396_length_1703_cov_453.199516_g315_i0.p1  ORF type:complete len:428 (-),score=105.94 NODE_396_length_1703_cov_453.199516_g315_i0:418-1605(-)